MAWCRLDVRLSVQATVPCLYSPSWPEWKQLCLVGACSSPFQRTPHAGVAGGGALALMLAGLACVIYARMRRRKSWSDRASKNGFDPQQSGASLFLEELT